VTWKLDRSAPEELRECRGKAGRLVWSRVRYDGFERTDRLIPTVLMESSDSPLGLPTWVHVVDRDDYEFALLAPA
jgi:hypothetical protein